MRIYKEENGQFNAIQTIVVEFFVYYVKIAKENLVISGLSANILFYKKNGSEYQQEQVFQGNNNMFFKLSISEDFKILGVGTNNSTL